ncbi:MAG: glutathione binding-like protein, partial [Hyphomicrobium sp.]
GGLGPMAGQCLHFRVYAKEPVPYAIGRYVKEVTRLFGVMERRLEDRDYLAGEYSIADIACYPWIARHDDLGQTFGSFPRLKAWFDRVGARPAVQRGMAFSAR